MIKWFKKHFVREKFPPMIDLDPNKTAEEMLQDFRDHVDGISTLHARNIQKIDNMGRCLPLFIIIFCLLTAAAAVAYKKFAG